MKTLLTLGVFVAFGFAFGAESMVLDEKEILTFGGENSTKWMVVNDGVMGGLSQSSMNSSAGETGIFSGNLSLENNGGFASVRSVVPLGELAGFNQVELRVKGDGRTYQLRFRTSDSWDGVAYRASFKTEAGEWTTHRFSFDEFVPSWRGRIVQGQPPLSGDSIRQVTLMVADKNPGSFFLEVESLRAFLVEE